MQSFAVGGKSVQSERLLGRREDREKGKDDATVPDRADEPWLCGNLRPRTGTYQTDCCEGALSSKCKRVVVNIEVEVTRRTTTPIKLSSLSL